MKIDVDIFEKFCTAINLYNRAKKGDMVFLGKDTEELLELILYKYFFVKKVDELDYNLLTTEEVEELYNHGIIVECDGDSHILYIKNDIPVTTNICLECNNKWEENNAIMCPICRSGDFETKEE